MSIKLWSKRKIKRMLENQILTKKMLKMIGGVFFCFILVFILIQNFFLPQIHLKGHYNTTLSYKEKYVEKGYKASFFGKDITKDVDVQGKVNEKKLGTYKIIYHVSVGPLHKKMVRIIHVKDTEKPVLNIDSSDIYLCPGDDVVPEKVSATDNYDGDLSNKIEHIISKNNDLITYRVRDKSGNISEVSKKIIYKDTEKPTIKLIGNETIFLFVGDEWNDPGVEVSDNCDSDLSSKVIRNGKVDTSKPGEYSITYTSKDSFDNEESIKRTIIVSERGQNGTIYLTFDDGPNSGTTNVILDILKEENVKATFFVTNKGPDDLIKREYDEGHTVALHTASHDYAIVYSSDEAYFNDLYSVQERVKRITGYESKIIRFPGGSSNTVSRRYSSGIMSRITAEVLNRGFKYYDWNLSSGDAGSTTEASGVYNNVISNLSHDRVNMVLMHDIKSYTRDALRDIIHYGKENGYTFEKITMETEMITQRVNN